MPINIVYEDPQALGEAAYYAAGRRRRRENIDRSIDRQLQADQANAQLSLNYEQLYQNVAQRNLDREAQYVDNVAEREFRRGHRALAFEQASDQAEAAHRYDLELLDARQSSADARRQRALAKADGTIEQLKREHAAGLWIGRESDYERALRRFEWEARGLEAPAPLPERPRTAQEEFDRSTVTLPDGRVLVPKGLYDTIHPAPREQKQPEPPPPPPPITVEDLLPSLMPAIDALTTENAEGFKYVPSPEMVQKYILGLQSVADQLNARMRGQATTRKPAAAAAASDSEVTVAPETPELAPSHAAAPPPPPPPVPAPKRATVKKSEIEAESKNHPPGTTLVDEEGNEYRVYRQAPPNVPYPKSQAEYDALRGGTKYWNPRLGMVVTKKTTPAENRALIEAGVKKVKGGVEFAKRLFSYWKGAE